LYLSVHDMRKVEILQNCLSGKLSISDVGLLLKRSERTVFRLLRRLQLAGIKGVVHGNRAKPSFCRTPQDLETKILALAKEKYRDVNDTHFAELLFKCEKIRIGRETLRRILRRAGIKSKRRRRKTKYRSRRERKEAMGMMLQIDASMHDWLESRGPRLTLVGAKDDATGYVWARFVEVESTWAYFELMEDVFRSHGLPLSLYSDRHSIFHVLREQTILEQLKDIRPLSQFGRAMDDLGISIIKAWSPQAKGRIERQWGTFQDRLVVEMRLADISSLEAANAFLQDFLPAYNQQFAIPAKQAISVFRQSPSIEKLDRTLCIQHRRVVANDHTISFEGLILQIPPNKRFYSLAKREVDVLQLKEGHIEICCGKQVVAHFSPASVTRMMHQYEPPKTELRLAA